MLRRRDAGHLPILGWPTGDSPLANVTCGAQSFGQRGPREPPLAITQPPAAPARTGRGQCTILRPRKAGSVRFLAGIVHCPLFCVAKSYTARMASMAPRLDSVTFTKGVFPLAHCGLRGLPLCSRRRSVRAFLPRYCGRCVKNSAPTGFFTRKRTHRPCRDEGGRAGPGRTTTQLLAAP